MPIVHIEVLEGRPVEKIKKLIENVTDTVVETLEVPKQNVRVLVSEVPKTHWGIGGTPVSDIQGR
ncbi:tautomerase [Paenibacillus abyssi]|uniref:Tautomerase n=1 Tax=Paenibacillus abyssi TaxID=1340531 RepID=A0A917CX81_9BACL|nr:4-oxalocrotonate tautomerase [Paenibacillus abyssi]GGG01087.1 tautomerase [Paenibacillus abyssi]